MRNPLPLIACLALTFSQATEAAIIQIDGDHNVTAILEVEINGTLYDVSFDGSFGSPTIFWGNESLAAAATQALAFELNVYGNGPYTETQFAKLAGGVTLVEIPFAYHPADGELNPEAYGVAGLWLVAGWLTYTQQFTQPPRDAPGIRLSVPEPSSAVLVFAVLPALFARRKR